MTEYLGEEEVELVDFIVGKMHAQASAAVILEELAKVLDDEADVFIVKLWRMLLFEILRAKATASS